MARVKGSFQTDSNYELGMRRPLDSRQLVTKINDLTDIATWEKYDNGDGTYYNNAFNGMMVACAQDSCIYVLKDRSQITSLDNGWVKIGPIDSIPSSNNSAQVKTSRFELPNVGVENVLYVITSTKEFMNWSSTELKYVRIASDWQDIELINGGEAEFIKTRYSYDYIPESSKG